MSLRCCFADGAVFFSMRAWRFHPAREGTILVIAPLIFQPFQMSDFKEQELQVQTRARDVCFRNLFEHAEVGVLLADSGIRFIDANPSACRMLGYSRDELSRLSTSDIFVQAGARDVTPALAATGSAALRCEMQQLRRKDGLFFSVDAMSIGSPDGSLLSIFREIGRVHAFREPLAAIVDVSFEKRGHDVERMSRLYASLSQINQAIVLTSNREALLARICEALVNRGAFRMAWVGWFDPQTARLVPVAVAGHDDGYVQTIEVYGDDRAEGRGPSGKAFRFGVPHVSQDISSDPDMRTWLAEATQRGFRSLAAFPIRVAGEVCGVLTVHAGEKYFFQNEETSLLEEAARDISFGLDSHAREDGRRKVEAIARCERAFSDTIIESTAGILYLYDEDGQFLRWNRSFETVTGYAANEIRGMRPTEFFRACDRPLLTARIAEVFDKGEASVEAPLLAKSGKTTPFLLTGRRIAFEGKTCLVGVGIDISERKRAEETLRELNESLERKVAERTADLQIALARAKAADQIKSAFLATMSHELRTPLNSIIGFSGIMLQGLAGDLNDEQKKQLGMVRGSARHLLALINDVLDISKIEAGELEVGFKPFDIKASIERMVASIMPMAEKKRLALSVDLRDLPDDFVSDQRRVEQMLLNLLSNAVKFTEQGGVKLSAEISSEVAGRAQPVLLVRVADTGIGIQAEHLPMLFQAFRQIDTGISRQHEGTGLGLAICRRLADRLGGDIQVESEFGRGSVFTLILPCKGGA
jgi:PAS domain S-box-containing protein